MWQQQNPLLPFANLWGQVIIPEDCHARQFNRSHGKVCILKDQLEFIKEVVHAPLSNEIIPVRVVESNDGIEILFNGYVFDSSDDDDDEEDSGADSDSNYDNNNRPNNSKNSNKNFKLEGLGGFFQSDNMTTSHSEEGSTSHPASYFPIRSLSADTKDKDFCPLKEKSTTQTSKTSFLSDFLKPSTNHPKPVIHSSGPSPIQPQNQNNPAKAHFSNGLSRSPSHNKISSLKSSTTSKPSNKTRYSSVPITLCQSQSRHPLQRKKISTE
ncbi:hypothetical protein Tco_1264749 [Tanacetum coccineum]